MQERFTIGSYCFNDEQTFRTAEKEVETIKYIRAKTNLEAPELVWKVYTKLINNQVFETPIGLSFLNELYMILLNSGALKEDNIPKIMVVSKKLQSKTTDLQLKAMEPLNSNLDATTTDYKTVKNDSLLLEEVPDASIREEAMKKEIDNRTVWAYDAEEKRLKKIIENDKTKMRNLKIVIFSLVLAIAGLFAVVYYSDVSPFADVEAQVIDKYAAWEQELTQKEADLKAREELLKDK